MIWNAENLTLKITDRRLKKLFNCIILLLEEQSFTVRSLASFVGQVTSLGPVMGGITRLRTKFSQMIIASSESFDSMVSLMPMVTKELLFWKENALCVHFKRHNIHIEDLSLS